MPFAGRGIRVAATVLCALALLTACSVEFGVGVESGVESGIEPGPVTPTPAPPAIPPDALVPDATGGLVRNRETEAAIPDLLVQLRDQLPAGAVVVDSVTFAVYHQPDVAAPNGDLLLLRGAVTDPDALLAAARARPGQEGSPTTLDLGAGARGVCTQSRNSGGFLVPICVWESAGAFRQIAPLTPLNAPLPPPSTAELVAIVKAIVPDVG